MRHAREIDRMIEIADPRADCDGAGVVVALLVEQFRRIVKGNTELVDRPGRPREILMNEMRGAKVDYQVVFFGGAVHSFTVHDAGSDPSQGSAYDPKADDRSWKMLVDFLKEVLTK